MHARVVLRLILALPATAILLLAMTITASARSPAVPGMPLLQRFSPDDYQAGATNLAVLASPDGIVYVGNESGLLHFDGAQWGLLELPRRSIVRALAQDPSGRLYVGGYDQFGAVDADPTGALVYTDLRGQFGLDPANVSFGDVWDVVRSDGGMYFRTSTMLFMLADDGNHQAWPINDGVRQLFPVRSQIYARVHGTGLSRFEHGNFKLIAGGERFEETPVLKMFAHRDGVVVLGTDGFLLATDAGMNRLHDTADLFASAEPYTAIELPQGGILVGTNRGGLMHLSPDYRLLAHHSLGRNRILSLSVDREGAVWAATERDLLRLRIPAPWSLFSTANGLPGLAFDSAFHDDALWVATSQGVFRKRAQQSAIQFDFAIETALEATVLLTDPSGLLIGDREGVLWLPTGQQTPQRIARFDTAYGLRRSKFDPDQILAFGVLELIAIRRTDAQWTIEQRWPLGGVDLADLYQAAPHEFWISDYRGGVIRWILDPSTGVIVERREFGAADGLHVDPEFGTVTNELDDVLYATSGSRSFRREGARFVEIDLPPFNMVERPWELDVTETPLGAYAHTSRELLRRNPDGHWTPVHHGAALARGYSNVHMGADGLLRLLTWNGLLQYDPAVNEPDLPALAVGLRSLALRTADGRFSRLPLPTQSDTTILLPAEAMLHIDFRLLSMEPGSEFRFRIEGVIDAWTNWGPVTGPGLTLRHPGPGRYRVHIEGRTRSGRPAQPLAFTIDAEPRWWQTGAAMAGGMFALALLITALAHLVARVRYRQFVATNHRLERRIAERTEALEAANRKLLDLATEDSLTGVANRRALEQAMLREWARCRDLSQPLSVVMIDVDHFKQFNDVHGHLAGDQQLIRVARILSEHVRPVSELLARFGGEEFALVLPGVTQEQAMQRADAIRRSFIGPLRSGGGDLTISAGVACVVPGPRMVPDDLIRAADMALYAAKRGGRNRVMAATEPRIGGLV